MPLRMTSRKPCAGLPKRLATTCRVAACIGSVRLTETWPGRTERRRVEAMSDSAPADDSTVAEAYAAAVDRQMPGDRRASAAYVLVADGRDERIWSRVGI